SDPRQIRSDPRRTRSPDAIDPVRIEYVFVAADWQILDLRLRDEHAIEGVLNRAWQAARALSVQDCYVEAREALAGDASGKIGGDVDGSRQPSEARLRRNLPCRRGADKHLIGVVRHDGAHLPRQAFVAVQPPEERGRIQQKAHVSLPSESVPSAAD